MIWLWIFGGVVLILSGLFIFSQGGESLGPFVSTIGLVILLVLLMRPTHGRDLDGRYAQSPLKGWFDNLKSKGGSLCCSDADGTALSDVDWETKDGHYRARIEGEWIDVPDDAVIEEPNRAGRTMVWPMKYIDGSIHIRCFMPGSMT